MVISVWRGLVWTKWKIKTLFCDLWPGRPFCLIHLYYLGINHRFITSWFASIVQIIKKNLSMCYSAVTTKTRNNTYIVFVSEGAFCHTCPRHEQTIGGGDFFSKTLLFFSSLYLFLIILTKVFSVETVLIFFRLYVFLYICRVWWRQMSNVYRFHKFTGVNILSQCCS